MEEPTAGHPALHPRHPFNPADFAGTFSLNKSNYLGVFIEAPFSLGFELL